MERKSVIAIVGTVAGVLVAGSVASVAVINAASAGTTKQETVPLTALQQGQELLDLPVVADGQSGIDIPVISSAGSINTTSISAKAAKTAVRDASGGSVMKASRVMFQGFDAYAVKVTRPDKSVVTGYVDSSTGVIFSWVVNKEAPAPVAAYGEEEYEKEDYEEEEYEEEEYEEEEYEEEEHDNDDD